MIVVGADDAAREFLGRFPSIGFAADAAEAIAAVERVVGTVKSPPYPERARF